MSEPKDDRDDRDDPSAPSADAPAGPRGLLAPSTLRPLELDLRAVFWVIIAGWAVALAVVGVLAATRSVDGRTVAICAAGLALGFVALAWESWHAASARRRSVATAADGDARPDPGGPGVRA